MTTTTFCYVKGQGLREVQIIDQEPTFVDTGEKVPDEYLKGYMSTVFNPFFSTPSQPKGK